jgi:hypothetical protein
MLTDKLRKETDQMVRTLVDMEASYLSASFFRYAGYCALLLAKRLSFTYSLS